MRTYKKESIKKMFIVGLVLAVLQMLIMVIGGFATGMFEGYSVIVFVGIFGIASPLMIFVYVGIMLNWRKILRGLIAPIPVLSSFWEYFKGMFLAIVAFIQVIVKKKDTFTVGSGEE